MSRRFASATRLGSARVFALLVAGSFLLPLLPSLVWPGLSDRWDSLLRDWCFRARFAVGGARQASAHLVHVVLDDSTDGALRAASRDRRLLADVLGVLQTTQARLIVCDILPSAAGPGDDDRSLEEASQGPVPVVFPLVVHPATDPGGPPHDGTERRGMPAHATIAPEVTAAGDPPVASRLVLPLPALCDSAAGLGHINISPDRDGVTRRMAMLYRHADGWIPSLTLRALIEYFAVPPTGIEVRFGSRIRLRDARIADGPAVEVDIPIDRSGRMAVDYRGPWDASFRSIPARRLLDARRDERTRLEARDLVEGSIILVSDVSTGGGDYGRSVFEPVFPLSGLHLYVLDSVLAGRTLRESPRLLAALSALPFALALWWAAARMGGLRFPLACAGAWAAYASLHLFLFTASGLLPTIAAPTAGFLLALLGCTGYRLLAIQRERAALLERVECARKLEATSRQLVAERRGTARTTEEARQLASGGARPVTDAAPPPELREPGAFADIVTRSPSMLRVFASIEALATSDSPVLICGESGVGKELAARAIHRLSRRRGRFVCENVAGLDDTMFSDTLFGHLRGAFTDAESARRGLVEEAEGGTLFLDEIGDLPTGSQVKLLRFLEANEYRPLGSDVAKRSEARVIIATNADLLAKMECGGFREDLYYRLTHRIEIPPLRDRIEDLPLLVEHFVTTTCARLGRRRPVVPADLLPLLREYVFPGNVRELKSMIENALAGEAAGVLPMDYFRRYVQAGRDRMPGPGSPSVPAAIGALWAGGFPTLKQMERALIADALRRSQGSQKAASVLLGLSPSALSRRIRRDDVGPSRMGPAGGTRP